MCRGAVRARKGLGGGETCDLGTLKNSKYGNASILSGFHRLCRYGSASGATIPDERDHTHERLARAAAAARAEIPLRTQHTHSRVRRAVFCHVSHSAVCCWRLRYQSEDVAIFFSRRRQSQIGGPIWLKKGARLDKKPLRLVWRRQEICILARPCGFSVSRDVASSNFQSPVSSKQFPWRHCLKCDAMSQAEMIVFLDCLPQCMSQCS